MPPDERQIPRNIAEPPQGRAPQGVFADRLRTTFLGAAADLAEVGEPGELRFHPDRSWHGYTYVPVTGTSSSGLEVYGYVRFVAGDGDEPHDFSAYADFTEETAAENPEWQIDLCDEVIGSWRGENGAVASITLVWGSALHPGGEFATAELGEATVDQCPLEDDRFTLIAPDDYADELLEVRVFSADAVEIARESLYAAE